MVRADLDVEYRSAEASNGATTLPDELPELDAAGTEVWSTATGRLLVSALALLFAVLLALGFALHSEALRLTGVIGVLVLGVGAAPCQLADGLSFGERCGIAIMAGLSVSSLAGAAMVLAPLWNPLAWAVVIGLAATVAHAVGVRRSMLALQRAQLRVIPQLTGLRSQAWSVQMSSLLFVVGTALWLFAALRLGHITPGINGFLPHISYAWYGGLLMLVAAIVLSRYGSETQIAAPVLMLIAALTLTPALLYGEPESQSAAKHVLLVQYILQVHRLHPDYLYYAFSGFFDGMAWLCRVARIANPGGLATYWPALIGIMGAVELRFLLGRVIRSPQRCWIGVLIAALANSVGQNYFSPQSEAFVIALGVFALVIAGTRRLALSERAGSALVIGAGLALAVTHELTPYIAGGALVVLAFFRVLNRRWAGFALLIPAGGWAALHLHALAGFVNLHDLGDLTNFKPPPTLPSAGLVRAPVVGYSTYALVLGVLMLVGLTCIALMRNYARGGAWGFTIAAGVGLVFIAVNPYGNEGIFRATLFAIPWLTMIGLAAVRKPHWRWWPGLAAVLTVFLACNIVSSFGLDASNVVRAADVSVLDTYARDAPPGSYHLEVAASGDLPTSLDPHLHNLVWTALWDAHNPYQAAIHSTRRPTRANLNALTKAYVRYARKISHTPASNLFVAYSPPAAEYSVEYAVETMKNSRQWLQLFLTSSHWRVVYAADGSYLLRYATRV